MPQLNDIHRGPKSLWVVRHGQSSGNVARDAAESSGVPLIDIATRDIDTPLSELGERQAQALGKWLASLGEPELPTVVLCSPYIRALESARLMLDAAGLRNEVPLHCDERLREKEFGILDRLTVHGIKMRHPELHAQRGHVGKFYFRPPGGESWCDVILRLRGVVDSLVLDYSGERVLLMAHQVVVNCMRYLLERLSESEILTIDAKGDVPNCGLTAYEPAGPEARRRGLNWQLRELNFVLPLEVGGQPVTAERDAPAAAKP
jgi:broad specificity phosphatase PhoE